MACVQKGPRHICAQLLNMFILFLIILINQLIASVSIFKMTNRYLKEYDETNK